MSKQFDKIKDAFEKVKLDITLLRENLLANYKEDREREKTIIILTQEISILKNKIKSLELKKIIKKTSTEKKTLSARKTINGDVVIGNNKSHKIHHPSCQYARNLNSKNKVEFENVRTALKEGYQRCTCIFNT